MLHRKFCMLNGNCERNPLGPGNQRNLTHMDASLAWLLNYVQNTGESAPSAPHTCYLVTQSFHWLYIPLLLIRCFDTIFASDCCFKKIIAVRVSPLLPMTEGGLWSQWRGSLLWATRESQQNVRPPVGGRKATSSHNETCQLSHNNYVKVTHKVHFSKTFEIQKTQKQGPSWLPMMEVSPRKLQRVQGHQGLRTERMKDPFNQIHKW